MFCQQCGTPFAPQYARCPQCNWHPAGAQFFPAPQSRDMGQDAGMRLLLPVGRSTLAIAAGYLGLFSVLILPAPLALGFGILAVRDIRRHPEKHGLGRAIFGIAMGGLFSLALVVGLIAILIAPNSPLRR